jgi:ParB/RepB/Spo0J family partition protein
LDSKKNAACTLSVRQIEKNKDLALGTPQKDVAKYENIVSAFGNVVPVTVVADGGNYRLIDGHARLEACARAGVKDIPVVVAQAGEGAEQITLSLLLSASREQGSPLSEGAMIDKLVKDHSRTLRDLSKLVGRSKAWLSKRQTMARNLAPPLRGMVMSGAVCARAAEEISKLPQEEQPIFASCVVRDGLSKDEVSRLVRLYRSPDATLALCRSIIESPTGMLAACKPGGQTRRQRATATLEGRIGKAAYLAANLLEEIGKMVVECDAEAIAPFQAQLLNLRDKMGVVAALLHERIIAGRFPGETGGGAI